jgi:hypothetical protein
MRSVICRQVSSCTTFGFSALASLVERSGNVGVSVLELVENLQNRGRCMSADASGVEVRRATSRWRGEAACCDGDLDTALDQVRNLEASLGQFENFAGITNVSYQVQMSYIV